jgi:hypothetical protein
LCDHSFCGPRGFGTPPGQRQAFACLGQLLLGRQQDLFGLLQIGLGQLDLFSGTAGGLLGFLSPSFGQARLFPGRLKAAFGFGDADASQLDFVYQSLRAGGGF